MPCFPGLLELDDFDAGKYHLSPTESKTSTLVDVLILIYIAPLADTGEILRTDHHDYPPDVSKFGVHRKNLTMLHLLGPLSGYCETGGDTAYWGELEFRSRPAER